jgi:hypothetical protein
VMVWAICSARSGVAAGHRLRQLGQRRPRVGYLSEVSWLDAWDGGRAVRRSALPRCVVVDLVYVLARDDDHAGGVRQTRNGEQQRATQETRAPARRASRRLMPIHPFTPGIIIVYGAVGYRSASGLKTTAGRGRIRRWRWFVIPATLSAE